MYLTRGGSSRSSGFIETGSPMTMGDMRTTNVASLGLVGLVGLVGLAGCQPAVAYSHGATLKEYGGTVPLVFTNASPDRMCGLYMSFDDAPEYGDNWLSGAGLASGKSLELRVRQGKYKARWDTCPKAGSTPTYAATRWREMAFVVEQETQLYAYVADTVAPTARAAVLGRDYVKVMFQGQSIDPIGTGPMIAAAAPNARTTIATQTEVASATAAAAPVATDRFGDCIDGTAKSRKAKSVTAKPVPASKRAVRPSLRRFHDTADSSVAYRVR
jgi:hypothetical protein